MLISNRIYLPSPELTEAMQNKLVNLMGSNKLNEKNVKMFSSILIALGNHYSKTLTAWKNFSEFFLSTYEIMDLRDVSNCVLAFCKKKVYSENIIQIWEQRFFNAGLEISTTDLMQYIEGFAIISVGSDRIWREFEKQTLRVCSGLNPYELSILFNSMYERAGQEVFSALAERYKNISIECSPKFQQKINYSLHNWKLK